MSLIPSYAGRPAMLKIGGWTYFVSVRDAAYLATKRAWRRRLAASHPDRGGTSKEFQAAEQGRQAWLTEEVRWYAQLDLLPPDGFQDPNIDLDDIPRLRQAEAPRLLTGKWTREHARQPRPARRLASGNRVTTQAGKSQNQG